MGRKRIRRGPGQREISGKDFCLAEEVRYIQRRAAQSDGRFVTIGPLALFSTETGDAWLLDSADHLAVRVARDGDPEPVHLEETDTNFTIEWTGNYHIDGELFVYTERKSARVVSVFGYPTARIAALG
jgi:hypothetical protein